MSSSALQTLPILSLKDNYIWCIVHPKLQECVIVDPGSAQPVFEFLITYSLKLTGILITHHHWDHTNGISEIVAQYKVPVFGPAKETVTTWDHLLNEGDQIILSQMNFLALDIPGHTRGHIAYYGHGMLFTGDTLFTAGCGRLFEGSAKQMLHSLDKLAKFSDATQIYCGHEYTEKNLQFAQQVEPNNPALQERIKATKQLRAKNLPTVPATLLLEKQTNPFLRTKVETVIQAAEKYAEKNLPNREAVFAALRNWKNNF